jgi:UDP-N-acetylmuramyl pentapeptide phosphotransferase/UDP-N-acetylglucosamine-1-phosphate transferase
MNQLRTVGLALIVLGIVSFCYQGILTYKTRDKVIDAGPIQVTAEKTHKIEIPQVAGSVALIGRMVLLLAGTKRV